MKENFVLERLVRTDLKVLVPYDPHVIPGVVKLDANENPFDFPGEVKEYICREISSELFTRYPDPTAGALREGLSHYTGVPADCILAGNGSDEIILNLMLAFGTGREVLIASPTFSMYRIHAQVAGARWREIPRKDGFIPDLQALTDAAAAGNASMIFICSPNNPTGNAVSPEIIRELLEGTGALVVVDEAYIEFGGESCIPLLADYPNLVILKTFSKAFGLAGLRVGYLLAGADAVKEILRIKQPYNLNSFSQLAALLGKARLDWEELKTRYAGSGRQDTLIAHLGKLAREHNLTVHGIGCGGISTIDGIIVQPLEIKFEGRYDDVLAVSGELEKGNYCLEVKSIKFEQLEGNIQDNVENNNSISSPAENPEVIDSLNIMEAPVAAGLLINVYFLPDE